MLFIAPIVSIVNDEYGKCDDSMIPSLVGNLFELRTDTERSAERKRVQRCKNKMKMEQNTKMSSKIIVMAVNALIPLVLRSHRIDFI